MMSTDDVVEVGWQLGFSFKGKLGWGCVEKVHPSLYMGVGGVQKD
jgi:CRISPR/Cas system endoribonuclease Cas6 (RAMP superfamily)